MKKHTSLVQSGKISCIIDSFVIPKNSKLDARVAATEATLSYYILKHHMSFNSSNCTTGILKQLFDDSETAKHLSLDRTKTTLISTQVIAPYYINKVIELVANVPFLSVSTDASNHGAEKMFPVLIQFFTINDGICSKMIDLQTLPNERAQSIWSLLAETLNKFNLFDKCIAYSADNCNTNFGGVKRVGKENVYKLLKEKSNINLIGIGCPIHIIHNDARQGLDALVFDVQSIVMKIYKHFSIYTVRTESLK